MDMALPSKQKAQGTAQVTSVTVVRKGTASEEPAHSIKQYESI